VNKLVILNSSPNISVVISRIKPPGLFRFRIKFWIQLDMEAFHERGYITIRNLFCQLKN